MQKILFRRVLRDLRHNLPRYAALFFLVLLSMFMVVSLMGAAESIIQGAARSDEENLVEDGQFGVFVPLTDAEISQIEASGVTLQKDFSLDFKADDATVRVYQCRQNIDRFVPTAGVGTVQPGEILLEQHYADVHGLAVGSTLELGGRSFTVAGTGSTPDYDAAFEKTSSTTVDPKQFGVGFVCPADYEALNASGLAFQTESYTYTYRLGGSATDDSLKALLQSFELDRSKVTDTYFLDYLAQAEQTRTDLQDALDALADGCNELTDGMDELVSCNADLNDAADTLFDAMTAQVQSSLAEAGITVQLTAENYSAQLKKLENDPGTSAPLKETLRQAADELHALEQFRSGVHQYTDGVGQTTAGGSALADGMAELAANSTALDDAADQIFAAVLTMADQQLARYGLGLGLTADGYASQLDAAAQKAVLPAIRSALTSVRTQLDAVAAFRDGVHAYTSGADAAASGSGQLAEGLTALDEASSTLAAGADSVADAVLSLLNEQLASSGLDVTLTRDNFSAQLAALYSDSSAVDSSLRSALDEAQDTLGQLDTFRTAIRDYTSAVEAARDGSAQLRDGVQELQDAADDLLNKYFRYDLDNLTQFLPAAENPRINGAAGDVEINRYASNAAGVILMILFTYVISVFVVHNIEQESSIIGALYALGVNRRQLLVHYLAAPVFISWLGGACGLLLSLTPIGCWQQMQDTFSYYSLPPLPVYLPGWLLAYALVMPPAVAALVNIIVIRKELNRTALSLLRSEQKAGHASKISRIDLGRMGFLPRFQLRQLLREMRSAFAVLGGMFICLLVLMISLNTYHLCSNFNLRSIAETTYEYCYTYKYPTEEVPEGGTPAYAETLKQTAYGYDLEVMMLGIDPGNPYFDVTPSTKKSEVVISSSVAQKFGVSKGDTLVLKDEVNEVNYAFTVADVVHYSSALYIFMDRDAMQELFGQADDYYNVVFADHALDIENGRLYSTVSRESVEQASSVFSSMMLPMVLMVSVLSAVIFLVVLYLMVKVMVDRSAYSISLMKVFGYRTSEVRRLYLDGNFIVVALGALVCIPAAKAVMDAIYPNFIANVAIGMELSFSPLTYLGIYIAVLACYLLVEVLLVRRLNKMTPAEVLKNRE